MDKKERKKFTKARLLKGVRGSISIFLCLLLTPFLTISLSLLEYARYQELIELADEMVDLIGTSELANYDEYIHKRFGFLAVNQESALGNGAEELLIENAKSMGNQMVPDNVTVSGVSGATLKDNDILTKQLTDFSELTGTMAVVMEDLRLEELMNKLKSLTTFNNIMDTVDELASATESVTKAVEAVKKLQNDAKALASNVNSTVQEAKDFAAKVSGLFKKLGEEGIALPADASLDEISDVVQTFQDEYLSDIEEIYTAAKQLKDRLNGLKSGFEGLGNDIKDIKKAVEDARNSISNIGSANDADADGSISESAVKSIDDILKQTEDLVTTTLNDIKDDTIKTVKETIEKVAENTLENTGISGVAEKYYSILNGSYFSIDDETLTVSDEAKTDIEDLLKAAYKVYQSCGGNEETDIEQVIEDYLEDRFIPKININLTEIINGAKSIVEDSADTIKGNTSAKLGNMMTDLANLANKIFKLTVFNDPRLDATVNLGNPDSNANQDFIDAVGRLTDAATEFTESIGGIDIIGMLVAVKDMFVAVKDMLVAIFKKVGQIIEGISGLFSDGLHSAYERLIISGYMRHSLPCRLNAGELKPGGGVEIKGESLTSFKFDEIPRDGNMFKCAELEYVYAGTNSEKANQNMLFWDIYFLRLLIDLPSIFNNGEVSGLAMAATVASWVIYMLYILIEPFLDTLLLVNNTPVDIYKSYCWMTPSKIGKFVKAIVNATSDCEEIRDLAGDFVESFNEEMSLDNVTDSGGGMLELSYEDYALLLLSITVDTGRQVQRLGNLVNLETTCSYAGKGGTFSFGNTYVAVTVSADFTFDSFFDLGIASGGSPLIPTASIKNTVSY